MSPARMLSMILILRGGILMSTGDFPESLSQAGFAGIMLVGKFGCVSPARMLSVIFLLYITV